MTDKVIFQAIITRVSARIFKIFQNLNFSRENSKYNIFNHFLVFFIVEWEDSKIIDYVKREECIEKCPQLVRFGFLSGFGLT